MDRTAPRTFLGLLFLSSVLAGCGRRELLVPGEGVVTLDGKPVAGATVFLLSDGGESRTATAKTEADGTFRLATYGADGIAPGNYRVIVGEAKAAPQDDPQPTGGTLGSRERAAWQKTSSRQTPGGLRIPRLYTDPSTTPLRCSVPFQGELRLDLHATRP